MTHFTFSKTNLKKYSIVYPRFNMSYLVTLELEKLKKAIKAITGKEPKLYPDDGKEHIYEIVVANAKRDDAPAAPDGDGYVIVPVGCRLFVSGNKPHSSAAAVARLTSLIKKQNRLDSAVYGCYSEDIKSGKGYRLTWGDDFDGDEIDTSRWEIFYGDRLCYNKGVNGKKTCRCREDVPNTYVKDGKLNICAVETEDTYYGGMLCTDGIMRYKYGYIEISTQHPKGLGFWTALWMNGAPGKNGDYFAEIDVEECYGNGGDWAYGNTFAWPTKECKENKNGKLVHVNNKVSAKNDRGFFMDLHTFGFEWDEKKVTFTCDGFPYVTQNITQNPAEVEALNMPFFLRLSMALGFSSRGGITDSKEEWEKTSRYIVDYVNVYQKPGQALYLGKEQTEKIIK